MKKLARRAAGFAAVLFTAVGALCVAARLPEGVGQKAAAAAAGFILPAGNGDAFFYEEEEEDDGTVSSRAPASSVPPASSAAGVSPASSAPSSSGSAVSSPASSQAPNAKVLELNIGNSGTGVANFWVKNSTEKHGSIDFAKELKTAPALKAATSGAPQVLIYHTHTTESYDCVARSTDLTKTVCVVGDAIAAKLQSAGVGVVHDKTVHDYPAYDGSYDRSKVTMQQDLKKYPSIRVTLDIHRDAMHRTDGTMLKPVAVVNGKKAAQLMILAGCDDDGTLGFPNWQQNLRLALRLQQQLSSDWPGVARPLDFCARRYNEDMTAGSLLIEVGTDANALSEAQYTGELLGSSLARVLTALR